MSAVSWASGKQFQAWACAAGCGAGWAIAGAMSARATTSTRKRFSMRAPCCGGYNWREPKSSPGRQTMSIVLTPTAARLKLAKIIAAEAAAQVITVATNASPSVITIAGHGYKVGDVLFIVGATGNTAINGQRKVAT